MNQVKSMNLIKIIITLFVCTIPLVVVAQEVGGGTASPETSLWIGLIPLVVPILISGVKLIIPKLPKMWLPIIAPVLGAVAAIALHFAGAEGVSIWVGSLLGMAGVGMREIADQVAKTIVK
jgi:glycerol uptake facilitator-like aquaporin